MKQLVIERDAFLEFQPAVEKWPLGENWWIRSAYNAHTLHTQYTHQQHHHHCLILSFSPGLNEHTHTDRVSLFEQDATQIRQQRDQQQQPWPD